MEKKDKNQKKRKKIVIGLDEAGRGSLIGPVIAAAVMMKNERMFLNECRKLQNLPLCDSKKMSSQRRERVYEIAIKSSFMEWGIGTVSCSMIDKINILEATKKAMAKSLKDLIEKSNEEPNLVLIDGNFKVNSGFHEKPIIKGDEKKLVCMIAGIIAKVHRDGIIKKYSLKYPFYGWERNKGYGTKYHFIKIKKYGPSLFHRKTFNLHYP